MRKLSRDKRAAIIHALCEGNSINATSRMCRVSKLTVLRLLVDIGRLCRDYHDIAVRGLHSQRVQVDEIWSFVGCKQKNKERGKTGHGDAWTWIAMDADSKLVISYMVGERDAACARGLMLDVADRVLGRIQLTSDGLRVYLEAVENAFGFDVDYAQLVKLYGEDTTIKGPERKYSPGKCNGSKKRPEIGLPDKGHISTSYVERQNLTMRMSMRRFTRLTNAFSKKVANHEHAIALHYFYYNFIRKHLTIKTTPAVAAGIVDRKWAVEDLVRLLEDEERKIANGGRINREDRS